MKKIAVMFLAWGGLTGASFGQLTTTQTFPLDFGLLDRGLNQTGAGDGVFAEPFYSSRGRLRAVTVTVYTNTNVFSPVERNLSGPVTGELSVDFLLRLLSPVDGTTPVASQSSLHTRIITVPGFSDTLHRNRAENFLTVRFTAAADLAAFTTSLPPGTFPPPSVFVPLLLNTTHTLPAGTRWSRDIPPAFGGYGRATGQVRVTYSYVP